MKIYIDSDYKCHTANAEGRTEIETSVFDGKCQTFIEGYCYIPIGRTWIRDDGEIFYGEMMFPWINYTDLAIAQAQYELDEAAHMTEIAELVEIIYETDMEVIG